MTDEATPGPPLVTFALFAYNQERYIREAVEGAFAQTYHPLEIILSDDCSSDDTFAIMREMAAAYRGPHKVIVRRNETNLGLAEHVNQLIALASGTFLTIAAGDDVSKAHRVGGAVEALRADDRLTSLETGYVEIDDVGNETGRIEAPAAETLNLTTYLSRKSKRLVGASRTYRLATLRSFPPLFRDCPTEDTTLLLRCLLVGHERIASDASILRRIHTANLSAKERLHLMPPEPLRDQYLADISHAYDNGALSAEMKARATRWAVGEYNLRKSRLRLVRGEHPLTIAWDLAHSHAPWTAKLRIWRLLTRRLLPGGASQP